MPVTVSSDRYSRTAVLLHWLIAALILANLALGFTSAKTEGPGLHRWVLDVHKSVGFSILILSLVRLAWRIYSPPPPHLEGKTAWERPVASAVHTLFYFMMIAIPFIGWWISSAAPTRHAINVLGWHAPFLWVERGREFTGPLREAHAFLAYSMAFLLVVHIGAALKHRFVDRDEVMARMSLFRRRR